MNVAADATPIPVNLGLEKLFFFLLQVFARLVYLEAVEGLGNLQKVA